MKKVASILGIIMGVVLIVAGVLNAHGAKTPKLDVEQDEFRLPNAEFDTVDAGYGTFDVKGATFGGDFYTYIYGGVDEAVYALDSVFGRLGEVVDALGGIYDGLQVTTAAVDGVFQLNYHNARLLGEIGTAIHQGVGWILIAIGNLLLIGSLYAFPAKPHAAIAQGADRQIAPAVTEADPLEACAAETEGETAEPTTDAEPATDEAEESSTAVEPETTVAG